MVNNDQDLKDNNMLDNGAVDSDIKSDSNLLNGSDNVQDVEVKAAEVQTEVTSIAAEEERTGQKIDVPSPDDLYAKAASSYIRNMKMLTDLVHSSRGNKPAISRNGMNRILTAILQLPQDGMPVRLQNDTETAAFGIGQRIIADRYLMTHYHIVQQQKEMKKKQEEAAQQAQAETKTEGESSNEQ